MITKKEWVKHRVEYLKRAELENFADPDALLHQLAGQLHEQYIKTNTNILSGKNTLIKFHHGTFSLATPPVEDTEDLDRHSRTFSPRTHMFRSLRCSQPQTPQPNF